MMVILNFHLRISFQLLTGLHEPFRDREAGEGRDSTSKVSLQNGVLCGTRRLCHSPMVFEVSLLARVFPSCGIDCECKLHGRMIGELNSMGSSFPMACKISAASSCNAANPSSVNISSGDMYTDKNGAESA